MWTKSEQEEGSMWKKKKRKQRKRRREEGKEEGNECRSTVTKRWHGTRRSGSQPRLHLFVPCIMFCHVGDSVLASSETYESPTLTYDDKLPWSSTRMIGTYSRALTTMEPLMKTAEQYQSNQPDRT